MSFRLAATTIFLRPAGKVTGIYLRGTLLLEAPPQGSQGLEISFTNNGVIDFGGTIAIETTNGWGGQVKLSTNAIVNLIAHRRASVLRRVRACPGCPERS